MSEVWSLTLREDRRLRMFENVTLKKIVGSVTKAIKTRVMRSLMTYFSPNNIRLAVISEYLSPHVASSSFGWRTVSTYEG